MTKRYLVILLLSVVLGACGDDGGGSGDGVGWTGPKTDILPCDLIITEIMAKPSSPVTGRRWIELYNASSEEIDLNRVRLQLTKEGSKPAVADLRKSGANVLPPGEFLWVRLQGAALPAEEVEGLHVIDTAKTLAIPEEKFELAVQTMTGKVVHKVAFGATGSACEPAGGKLPPPVTSADQSLELQVSAFSCLQASSDCGAWAPAELEEIIGDKGKGTPGNGPTPQSGGGGGGGGVAQIVPHAGDVAVTEIAYRSSDDLAGADWFELVNLSDHWVNLQGCILGDGTKTGDNTIKEPVVLCPGQIALFSSVELTAAELTSVFLFGAKPNLNQSGDFLYLKCPVGEEWEEVFNLDFTKATGKFPVAATNTSIQLCPNRLPAEPMVADYHDPANWALTAAELKIGVTTDSGTPGQPNPDCGGGGEEPPGKCDPPCGEGQSCVTVNEVPLCARVPVAGDLVITEYMVNGSDPCSLKKDWFELHNLTGELLALEGCTLKDDTDSTYTLTGGPLVTANGFLVMVQDLAGCQFDAPAHHCYGANPNLNTGEDSVTLACGGQVVFTLNYGGAEEPPAPGTSGDKRVSVQLAMGTGITVTPAFAAQKGNWCLSTKAATCGDLSSPGLPNELCGGVEPPVGECDPPCTGQYQCADYGEQKVCARQPGVYEVLPTEVMVNGSEPCASGKDWFELLNLSGKFIQLKGCSLKDDTDKLYEIKQSLVLAPGEYVAMVQAAAPCQFDAPRFFCFGGNPNLNTGDDSVNLLCGGTQIFSLAYGGAGEVKAPKAVGSVKASVQADAGKGNIEAGYLMSAANWNFSCKAAACGDLSSPGAPNQVCTF